MNYISITFALKYELKHNPNYKISKCGKVFNMKSGRQLKKCYNNGSIGYWIDRKFITIKNLRKQVIKTVKLPF